MSDSAWETGRRRWPAIDVPLERWRAFVADREVVHAEDFYLACSCALGIAGAIEAFEARWMPEVPLFLTGIERDPAVIDEVKQLLREKLFVGEEKKIAQYSGRGSLGSWLRVVTLRIASNRRRGEKNHEEIGEEISSLDPELKIIQAKYRKPFDAALRSAFASLTAKERTLFRMHFVDGLSLDEMGRVFSVHRATVARWIALAREQVLERTMASLGDELRLNGPELESLLRIVRSSLDVSLQGLLAE